jgi:hypothetical protein
LSFWGGGGVMMGEIECTHAYVTSSASPAGKAVLDLHQGAGACLEHLHWPSVFVPAGVVLGCYRLRSRARVLLLMLIMLLMLLMLLLMLLRLLMLLLLMLLLEVGRKRGDRRTDYRAWR